MISMNKVSFTMALATFSCLSFLSTTFADTPAAQTATTDISGTYLCNYHDPFSNPQDGTEMLIIKKGSGNNYKMSKKGVNDTTPSIIGIGLVNKDLNNVLSFLFWRPTTMTTNFVQFFIVKPDGTLEGEWVQSNKTQVATFTCKKSSS